MIEGQTAPRIADARERESTAGRCDRSSMECRRLSSQRAIAQLTAPRLVSIEPPAGCPEIVPGADWQLRLSHPLGAGCGRLLCSAYRSDRAPRDRGATNPRGNAMHEMRTARVADQPELSECAVCFVSLPDR